MSWPGADRVPVAPGQAPPPFNVLAIVGFVLAFTVPPGAVACGWIALQQIRGTGEQGRGLAIAAIWIGAGFSALVLLFLLVWLSAFAAVLVGWLAVLGGLAASR